MAHPPAFRMRCKGNVYFQNRNKLLENLFCFCFGILFCLSSSSFGVDFPVFPPESRCVCCRLFSKRNVSVGRISGCCQSGWRQRISSVPARAFPPPSACFVIKVKSAFLARTFSRVDSFFHIEGLFCTRDAFSIYDH